MVLRSALVLRPEERKGGGGKVRARVGVNGVEGLE